MNHPMRTLLYDLFVAPVRRLWDRTTGRKPAKAKVQVRRTPAYQAYGNVAWEMDKQSWRTPAPVPVQAPPKADGSL